MEDDPPILNITAGLATLKRRDTVLAKGSDFNRRSSASDRVDQSVVDWIRVELSLSGPGITTDKTLLATLMSPMAVTRPEQLANFL